MTRYAALLRGINVGGRHTVPMAELRALFEALGHTDVATYIQSGNVVFSSELDEARLALSLPGELSERFGFEIPVVVRDAAALSAIADGHPLTAAQADERMLHVVFLGAGPSREALAAFDVEAFAPDRLVVEGREVYVSYAHGSGRSKLTVDVIERALHSTATGRNWRTVTRLAELAAS